MFSVTKEFTFSAAHKLRNYEGRCSNLHGHTYKVAVTLESSLTAEELSKRNGILVDFTVIHAVAKSKITASFDHKYLNDVAPFTEVNPTAELMAYHFYLLFKQYFEDNKKVNVKSVDVWETPTSYARYWEDGCYKTINEIREAEDQERL